MEYRDYYALLGVPRTADAEEIKRAYRKAAMKYHPDRGSEDPEADAKFKEASEAYEVLSDPERRNLYDRYGHSGLSGMVQDVPSEAKPTDHLGTLRIQP